MAIPDEQKWKYIFHFTDIRNLDSIIKHGLLCTNVKNEKGIKHKNIANLTIQERRATMDIPVDPGGKVHDYVPFYFSSVNPMLLTLLNQKNVDQNLIIYLCIKIQRLEKEDAVFTDASANTNQPPNFYNDTNNLDKLNWGLIDKWKWGGWSDEEKHHKMAEAFIHKKVDIKDIDNIVVFNDTAKVMVEKVFGSNDINHPEILYDGALKIRNYHFYYTKLFFPPRKRETLVTGPVLLLDSYKNLIVKIKAERSTLKNSHPYLTVSDLVNAIDQNFSVLPELRDVTGLLQGYPPHNDAVDDHTRKVVSEMRKQAYYQNTTNETKGILSLAAYLHDIGKGPKTKWENEKMIRAYPDHPADAIPMLKRILVEEVENLTDEEIRLICMLVVYHDIIGDCMEKGREKQQVVDVIENEDDLEMLFAISCADARAINGAWALGIFGRKKSFAETIMKMKKS